MSAKRDAKPQVRRTDGVWDPAARPMFFLAGNNGYGRPVSEQPDVDLSNLPWPEGEPDPWLHRYRPQVANLFAVNDFAQPGQPLNREEMEREFLRALDAGCPVFLDSGIFWLTNQHKRAHGITMDQALSLPPDEIDNFDWLLDTYVELVSEFRDRLWGYNELDQGGRVCKTETRAHLESLGLNPIPVYHPLNDGWGYFDELAQRYDRICWGNVVQAGRFVRARMLATLEERHRKYPDLWVHLLGYTPNEWLNGLPFDSCDSSTWTAVFRYPQAWRERAMAKPVSGFDHRYWISAGEPGLRSKGSGASVTTFDHAISGVVHWRQRLRDEVGMVDFPEFRVGEEEPCPASQNVT